jgi:hypothetical protein
MENTKSAAELEIESFELLKFTVPEIDGQEQYDTAVDIRTELANFLKEAEASFKAIKDPVWQEHKKICKHETDVCEPVREKMRRINNALIAFDREQEQKRIELQRRMQEEANRQEAERRLAAAANAEAQGMDEETVSAVLEQDNAPIVHAAPTYEKSKAVTYRDNYSATVTDLQLLVKYIAKNPTLINLIQINQPALNTYARSLKSQLNLPGVRVVNNRVVSTGRR